MFIPAPSGGNFTPVPAGNHVAVCYRFIDLGTQKGEYKGKPKSDRKVIISWELPDELMQEGDYAGQPFTIGNRYTWSMNEKATLRKTLESWRNKKFIEDDFKGPNRFNVKNVLGKGCMLNIALTEKDGTTYSNIASIGSLPKGMAAPALKNEIVYFSLEPGLYDPAVLEKLSDKLKETIRMSPEWAEVSGNGKSSYQGDPRDLDDEVPF